MGGQLSASGIAAASFAEDTAESPPVIAMIRDALVLSH